MDWMKQQILRKVVSTVVGNSIVLAFAMVFSGSVALYKISTLIPVKTCNFAAPYYDEHLPYSHLMYGMSPSCKSFLLYERNEGNLEHSSYLHRFYGVIRKDNNQLSPSPGFLYDIIVRCSFIVPIHRSSLKANTEYYDMDKIGAAHIIANAATGIIVVNKYVEFNRINVSDVKLGVSKPSSQFVQFELTSNLISTGSGLLAPVSDVCVKFHWFQNDSIIETAFHSSVVEVSFKLDCRQDIYTRLMCMRLSKLFLLCYMWLTLSVSLMILTTVTLFVSRVVNFVLIHSPSVLLLIDWVARLKEWLNKSFQRRDPFVEHPLSSQTNINSNNAIAPNVDSLRSKSPTSTLSNSSQTQTTLKEEGVSNEFNAMLLALNEATRMAQLAQSTQVPNCINQPIKRQRVSERISENGKLYEGDTTNLFDEQHSTSVKMRNFEPVEKDLTDQMEWMIVKVHIDSIVEDLHQLAVNDINKINKVN